VSVDLDEPSTRVFRFHGFGSDFGSQIAAALAVGADHGAAAGWRAATSWDQAADRTIAAYRYALGESVCAA
jgi:hypothetical protein